MISGTNEPMIIEAQVSEAEPVLVNYEKTHPFYGEMAVELNTAIGSICVRIGSDNNHRISAPGSEVVLEEVSREDFESFHWVHAGLFGVAPRFNIRGLTPTDLQSEAFPEPNFIHNRIAAFFPGSTLRFTTASEELEETSRIPIAEYLHGIATTGYVIAPAHHRAAHHDNQHVRNMLKQGDGPYNVMKAASELFIRRALDIDDQSPLNEITARRFRELTPRPSLHHPRTRLRYETENFGADIDSLSDAKNFSATIPRLNHLYAVASKVELADNQAYESNQQLYADIVSMVENFHNAFTEGSGEQVEQVLQERPELRYLELA